MKRNPQTIENYIEALCNAFIVYRANWYDVKGKKLLQTHNKYYLVDMGLRKILLGRTGEDKGFVLENIAYLELLRRGYNVDVGKVNTRTDNKEQKILDVDFIAETSKGIEYYHVSDTLNNPETLKRELAS